MRGASADAEMIRVARAEHERADTRATFEVADDHASTVAEPVESRSRTRPTRRDTCRRGPATPNVAVMLRLIDHRTGRPQDVGTNAARRVRVAYPGHDLRAAIAADTARRVAARHRLTVTVHRLPHDDTAADPAGDVEYNMPAPTTGEPDGPIDVWFGATTARVPVAKARLHVLRPPALVEVANGDAPPRPEDPLALRLLLLTLGPHEPLRADRRGYAGVDDAVRTLAGLRELTALCAESPSAALPADAVAPIHAALDADLDTPAAVRLLVALSRDELLAPGARFEALVHVDRFLALDLARDVGRPRD